MEKIWYKTEFVTEETDQTISIYEEEGSLVMEINDEGESKMVHLNEAEAHFLARKLVGMSHDIFRNNKIERSSDDDIPF